MTQQTVNMPIILTHPADSGDFLLKQIGELGLNVVVDPMVMVSQITLTPKHIKEICNADVLIFTSKRGVQYAMQQIKPICCHAKQIAVIGKKTAEAISPCHDTPVWVSSGQSSTEMCTELLEQGIVQGKKVVAILAQLAENTIEEMLGQVCEYKRINIYKTKQHHIKNSQTDKLLSAQNNVGVVFTSASAVHAFARIYPQFKQQHIKCFSIGPSTSMAIVEMGQTVAHQAKTSTYEALLALITENITQQELTQ